MAAQGKPPFGRPHFDTPSFGKAGGAPPVEAPRRVFGITPSLGVVGCVVGGVYGYSAARAYAPGAEWLAVLITGLVMGLAFMGFWRLLHVSARSSRLDVLRGALAGLLSVPVAIMLGTAGVLFAHDPGLTLWQPEQVFELAVFMMKFMVMTLGFLTLPTAAIAAAATVRWRSPKPVS